MNIYIDESGSFVNAPTSGAWNAVAALVVIETSDEKIDQLLDQLKISNGHEAGRETKLNDVTENTYLQFIGNLADLNIVVFSTATDSGLNTTDRVLEHQQRQVAEILRHIDKMKYEGGRQGVQLVASQLEKLSPQLYVQLLCQVNLMFDVVSRVITYYVQRDSDTLAEFRWRIDQKNISQTDFEDAFEKLSPPLLQTRSMSEPLLMVNGFDYSSLRQYEFEDGKVPNYLKEVYGIEVEAGINIQKLIRSNIKFMDSKDSSGIQAVDLVVSGIRRCLRRQFSDNNKAAYTIGKLMLQAKHNAPPLNLISFANDRPLEIEVARLVRMMSRNCKSMIMRS
ncbi:DUF3800 domain-containing protein [Candidatus Latescibacterota bacterium]